MGDRFGHPQDVQVEALNPRFQIDPPSEQLSTKHDAAKPYELIWFGDSHGPNRHDNIGSRPTVMSHTPIPVCAK